jgi:hypothetical protein
VGHLEAAVGAVVVAGEPRPSAAIAIEVYWPTFPTLSRVAVLALIQVELKQCGILRSWFVTS